MSELPNSLLAALAAPHTHEVVIAYANGASRKFTTRNEKSAESYAKGERRKIGRELISRDGGTVRVVSVTVQPIA